ncbi:MAG: helix-turn-helix domain-containing protein [Lachnospiraceae bacterium]|nr:helix-turn-helix domain-containing protein [Lachnospiraceae bacterium]
MNQELTGSFIAQLRKEKNMTQKELADKLGISDKTVSKWETGNGTPDVSLLQPLCKELSVNLNELLSGERLSDESYSGKAEENMMKLAKDAEDGRKNKKVVGIIGAGCGVLVLASFIEFAIICSAGLGGFFGYLDLPSIIIMGGVLLGIELISGRFIGIFRALGASITNKKDLDDETRMVYVRDLKFAIIATIISMVLSNIIGFISMLNNMEDVASIGPSVSVLFISILYAAIIVAFLYAFRERLK